jgi:hypothetical protein
MRNTKTIIERFVGNTALLQADKERFLEIAKLLKSCLEDERLQTLDFLFLYGNFFGVFRRSNYIIMEIGKNVI